MTKERLLKLAKEGILEEIRKWDSRAKRFRNKAFEVREGIDSKISKTEDELLALAEKYEAKKKEAEKEFDIIDSLVFGLDFE